MKNADTDLVTRSRAFAVRVIALTRSLPRDIPSSVITRQIIRSSTSISANITEAQSALTKKEFIYSMNVAKKEAKETLNWLILIRESKLCPPQSTGTLERECDEIVAILMASVKTAMRNKA